ncbi:hypothetical protein PTNB29_09801 [Pyrenophora teres f. teres]|nr:hypothetical protein PTNB29_09801 [Pyrenophora teres f. teres]
MDPLSITVSCVTLVTAVSRVTYSLTGFIREWRDASSDLRIISQELSSMQIVIGNLRNTFATKESTLPPNLKEQILGILKSCLQVVGGIEASLLKHANSRLGKGGYWALGGGKEDMAKYRSSLEAHKSALEITLELVSITISRDIKKDTTQILKEMAKLRQRLPIAQAQYRHSSPRWTPRKEMDNINRLTEIYQHEDEAYISGSNSDIEKSDTDIRTASNVSRPSTYQDYRSTAYAHTSTSIPYIQFSPYYHPQTDTSTHFPSTTVYLSAHTNTIHLGRYSKTRSQERNFVGFASRVVSRMHCDIWHKEGKWYIRDNKSLAGTWLNSERLSEAGRTSKPYRLRDGDVVQLGMDYHGGCDANGLEGYQDLKESWRHVRMFVHLGQH